MSKNAIAQEPVAAFYLDASDWGGVRVPLTPHRIVCAYRHGFDHGGIKLIPFYATPAAPGIDLHAPCTEAVYALARKLLWIAYVWNDHNFDHPYNIAREVAQEFGIESFDQANAWLTEQAKLIDASPKGGSDAYAAALVQAMRDARAGVFDQERHVIATLNWLENRASMIVSVQATIAEIGA